MLFICCKKRRDHSPWICLVCGRWVRGDSHKARGHTPQLLIARPEYLLKHAVGISQTQALRIEVESQRRQVFVARPERGRGKGVEGGKGAIITSSFKDLQQGGWALALTDTVQSACLGLD